MKDTAILLISGAVSAGAAALLTLFVAKPDASAAAETDAAAPGATTYEAELEALERKQEELATMQGIPPPKTINEQE